jgi:hypothetical protein
LAKGINEHRFNGCVGLELVVSYFGLLLSIYLCRSLRILLLLIRLDNGVCGPSISSGSTLPEILPSASAAYFSSSAPRTMSFVDSSDVRALAEERTQECVKVGETF